MTSVDEIEAILRRTKGPIQETLAQPLQNIPQIPSHPQHFQQIYSQQQPQQQYQNYRQQNYRRNFHTNQSEQTLDMGEENFPSLSTGNFIHKRRNEKMSHPTGIRNFSRDESSSSRRRDNYGNTRDGFQYRYGGISNEGRSNRITRRQVR